MNQLTTEIKRASA